MNRRGLSTLFSEEGEIEEGEIEEGEIEEGEIEEGEIEEGEIEEGEIEEGEIEEGEIEEGEIEEGEIEEYRDLRRAHKNEKIKKFRGRAHNHHVYRVHPSVISLFRARLPV